MKTGLGLAALLFLIHGSVLHAEESPKPNPVRDAYLEELQLKLDHAARRANQPKAGASSVIGLRGSKQEPLSKQLYWKGKTGGQTVTPQEVKEYRSAVEQAKAGQTIEAIAALKALLAKYPDTALKPDIEETIRVLSEPVAPAAPASNPA